MQPSTVVRVSPSGINATVFEQAFDVRSFGAVGDGIADDTLAIQAALNAASNAGFGSVFLPPGTYLISNTLFIHKLTTLFGYNPNNTYIRLANNSNCVMLKTFKFDTFSGGTVSKLSDDPDMTWGWSIRGITFDGNWENQATPVNWDDIGGLFLYGRRIILDSVYVIRTNGIGIYTELGLPAIAFEVAEDDRAGYFHNILVEQSLFEGWVFRGPVDTLIEKVQIQRIGDPAFDDTVSHPSYPTSLLYPGETIDGFVLDGDSPGSAHPGNFDANCELGHVRSGNVFLGWAMRTRGSVRTKALQMFLEGSYGGGYFAPSSKTQIALVATNANSRNRDRTLRPHIQVETDNGCEIDNIEVSVTSDAEQDCNKIEIAGAIGSRVQLGNVHIIAGTNGRGGHGLVINRADVHVGSLVVSGLNGPAADALDSTALYFKSLARRSVVSGGYSLFCDVGVRNDSSNDAWQELNFAPRVKLGQFADSVAVAPVILTATPAGTILQRANIVTLDETSGSVRKFSSFFGTTVIDDTLTTEQTAALNHEMWRTPGKSEVQLTLNKDSGTPATLQYMYVTSITATQINVAVKYSAAGTGNSTLGIRVN